MKWLIPLLTLISCTQYSPNGSWRFDIHSANTKIPFYLNVKDKKATILNAGEEIELSAEVVDGVYTYPIGTFDAALVIRFDGDKANGHWIKYNRTPEYKVAIKGIKDNPPKYPEELFDRPRKWEIDLQGKSTTKGMLLFSREHASVLTPTGDYRFLFPQLKGNQLTLSGFDGIFAFKFEGILDGDTYNGTMYAGKDYQVPFKSLANVSFELPDPTQVTSYKGDISKLKLKRLGADIESVIKPGKLNIIQIFGSWCPNCIDETAFLQKWLVANPTQDIHISMIAFERSPNQQHALMQLKKAQKKYQIDYPIYIGGYDKTSKVEDAIKGLSGFASFPTTLYIDKKGTVRKIHSGFNGPATGRYYEAFIREFGLFIDKLTRE
jgi:thiol-disulfide isomerase/thioredoxin